MFYLEKYWKRLANALTQEDISITPSSVFFDRNCELHTALDGEKYMFSVKYLLHAVQMVSKDTDECPNGNRFYYRGDISQKFSASDSVQFFHVAMKIWTVAVRIVNIMTWCLKMIVIVIVCCGREASYSKTHFEMGKYYISFNFFVLKIYFVKKASISNYRGRNEMNANLEIAPLKSTSLLLYDQI